MAGALVLVLSIGAVAVLSDGLSNGFQWLTGQLQASQTPGTQRPKPVFRSNFGLLVEQTTPAPATRPPTRSAPANGQPTLSGVANLDQQSGGTATTSAEGVTLNAAQELMQLAQSFKTASGQPLDSDLSEEIESMARYAERIAKEQAKVLASRGNDKSHLSDMANDLDNMQSTYQGFLDELNDDDGNGLTAAERQQLQTLVSVNMGNVSWVANNLFLSSAGLDQGTIGAPTVQTQLSPTQTNQAAGQVVTEISADNLMDTAQQR
ncbi:MAG: hypothetical protein SFZ03_02275 [Candidatus Melainabacteria bacterium]|nr:hypothetical protein [Candidatus Melainabacteria bacterium]